MKSGKSLLEKFRRKSETEQERLDRIKAEVLAEDAESPAGKSSRRIEVVMVLVSG